MVWLYSKDLPLRVESRKLAPRFVSPFPISKVVNLAAVQLNLPRSLRVHPTFHVAQIKPVKESALVPASRPPPTPRFIDGSLVFKVKRLLVVCQWVRGHQYLVDWQGYGAGNIRDPTPIRDFCHCDYDQPGTSGAVPRGGGTVMSRSSFQTPLSCSCGFVLLPDCLPHPDYLHLFTVCVYI